MHFFKSGRAMPKHRCFGSFRLHARGRSRLLLLLSLCGGCLLLPFLYEEYSATNVSTMVGAAILSAGVAVCLIFIALVDNCTR